MKIGQKIKLLMADITTLKVDAIVNAANSSLLGGGGVDGAIHKAAGPELLGECRQIGGCPVGEARITRGYRLPARFVIHTVGPVWRGGSEGEDQLLARCYQSCFALAEKYEIKSIAFPAISTGAYGFPIERACRIAIWEMRRNLEDKNAGDIIAVCFNHRTFKCYQEALQEF
ncbi:MAG TPA: O-acetyl-ADP-ribose deacetylase [Methanothrix soehngenii]|jgi:O-acetyl-ADP-ribose deacetylase (regulator of RNase III)|uniref:Appr-1-p processing enzyme family n=2 Tax=Methanothrix TaxID=2222 RepID=F4BTN0_METSG|nr:MULTISPECIES: O-acetyl-ADP-ribose deacetylase [Methanothrix]AEB69415.1 appr-1-p processing enzyme family [Methanothrix soehngenii GP6]MDY0411053.1 O-acetyl-ADP-ribose deacetylase [Methanothrix soehngenii]HNQ51643.1 O-acetyl-ADP-ribose deacetylase [Methanothrix soehngenii]HNT45309.1 O-acetyl-ADP-ribose deacetylase [Methanothrix soehngenii]HOE45491.1 O-acetyl-ADP-ribose deacetylase [Methanothrix soehngenii]